MRCIFFTMNWTLVWNETDGASPSLLCYSSFSFTIPTNASSKVLTLGSHFIREAWTFFAVSNNCGCRNISNILNTNARFHGKPKTLLVTLLSKQANEIQYQGFAKNILWFVVVHNVVELFDENSHRHNLSEGKDEIVLPRVAQGPTLAPCMWYCLKYVGVIWLVFFVLHLLLISLCLWICVALANLWWNTNKNQIEKRIYRNLVISMGTSRLMIKLQITYLYPRTQMLCVWMQIVNYIRVFNQFQKLHVNVSWILDRVTFDIIN